MTSAATCTFSIAKLRAFEFNQADGVFNSFHSFFCKNFF